MKANKFHKILIFSLWMITLSGSLSSQNLFHLSDDVIFHISSGMEVGIGGSVGISNNAVLEAGNNSMLLITGDLTNSGSFTTSSTLSLSGNLINLDFLSTNSAFFYLDGTSTQTFSSATEITCDNLILEKSAGDLQLFSDLNVETDLFLLSNSLVELNTYDLTIGPGGGIYTDYANSLSFTETRCISNSSGTLGGALIYEIAAGSPVQQINLFPLGTPGVYTPGKITLNNCSFVSGAYVGMKAIDIEHPRVETTPASLTKYWNVFSDNITISDNGADLIFYYDPDEVNGNESAFLVMYYKPAYPASNGYWRVDPGLSNQVAWWGNYRFYTQETDSIDGDWTAGEEVAAISTYYSRANGDYNDNTTWSKENFGGAISNTIPNKQSDKVRISNNSVTITEPVAAANIVSIEAGGELVFVTDDYISGDTARLADDAKIIISHQNGITESTSDGNIQSLVRDLSSDAIYQYSGTFTPQQTGDGLPSNIRSLIVEKPAGTTLVMDEIVAINDSLVINSGSLDIDSYSIDGSSSGRQMIMRDGELIIRGAFPLNYSPPTFTSGTITFWKDGNNTYVNIPSDASSPSAVAQYKNLILRGNRTGASAVTFSSDGDTKISGIFDISELEFDTSIPRFNMDGSSVIFNQDGGTQQIPCSPGTVPDSVRNIEYYNLTVAGSGTKQLYSPFTPTFLVVNDFTIESSTFEANGYNFEVNQNWTNVNGVFVPGTNAVIFNSPVQVLTNLITSRSTIDNPFYDVVVSGTGDVQPVDNMLINGDLLILANVGLTMPSVTTTPVVMELKGNWTNNGGVFTPGSSTVTFTGASSQTITDSNGSENFNTLIVNNGGNGLYATNLPVGEGIIVSEYLDLSNGILYVRGRYCQTANDIIRDGAFPGHVDGALRKTVVTGATSSTYSVGYGTIYTPVYLDFNGSGGTSGVLQILSDTLTTTTSPISTDGVDIIPLSSNIMDSKNIRRQFTMSIPVGSTFALGANRTFDFTCNFVPGADPVGDVRGGADFNQFDVRLWTGTEWIGPDRYGTPRTGTRTSSSTQFSILSDLGTFIVGEPEHLSFYSIAEGNWSTPASWSTQHYFGDPTNIAPTDDAYIYVGNSHTITVDGAKTVDGFVWIDSVGTLLCQDFVLSGAGDFYLQKDGALGIGNADGITTAGATGNIQTTTRDYNVATHNRGHFIYTGNTNDQPTGNGLPTTVATLTVNKSGGSALRLTNDITVSDSLSITNGILLAREPATATARDIELKGNLYITSTGTFDPYQGDFVFSNSSSQTVTALDDIDFYDLTLINPGNKKRIWFKSTGSDMQVITINNSLVFSPTNLAYIDLSPTTSSVTALPVYNSGEWIMQIDQAALGISRLGQGHVAGDLRKWVPADDFTEIMYEVGHDSIYNPMAFDLDNAGGTAGYVSVQCVPHFHPEGDYLDDVNYNYQEPRCIQKYWRITIPETGTFSQGTRNMAFRCRYRDPQDIPGGALKRCFDLVYWMGPNNSDWQRLSPPSSQFNDNSTSSCGDRDINFGEATYRTFGTDTSTTAWDIDGTSISLSNYDLSLGSNNRILLADMLVAQQGPDILYYYSKNDGPWNSANTWVTSDFNNEAQYDNLTNTTNSWPKRRLDIAKIGNGKTVTLNCNIGTGYSAASGTQKFFEQRLGSCIVEETTGGQGKLILNTFQVRASVFELHDGGIISTGADEGFPSDLAHGNLIRQYATTTIARDFNYDNHDRGNYELTAVGTISQTYNQSGENYCNPGGNWSSSGGYMDDLYVDNGASYSTPSVFTYENTGNNRLNSESGYRYYCDTTIRLTAGNTYTFRSHVLSASDASNYYVQLWIDTDFDGDFSVAEGSAISGPFSSNDINRDITYTIPAGTPTGTTRIRLRIRRAAMTEACITGGGQRGENEDYTVFITQAGEIISQVTGDGIPTQIASVTVDTEDASSTVTQTSGLSMSDEFRIENGTFIPTTNPVITTSFDDYLFEAEDDVLEQLVGGTAPSLTAGTADEGYYGSLPLGFTFAYHGNSYTTVTAGTNGYLCFGTPATLNVNDLDANGGASRPIIAPLWDDLDMSSGQFSYKTEGISPDRIFVAEWLNVEWDVSAASPVLSFQVKLYESSGEIEFVYADEGGVENPGSASVGLTATSTGSGNFLSLDGTGVSPGQSTVTSTNSIVTKPADGQLYRFIPVSAVFKLQGTFTNNSSSDAFGEGTQGTIEFDGDADQEVGGTFSTNFYNVILNNDATNVRLMNDQRVNNWLSFKRDNFLELNQYDITFGPNAEAISPFSGEFSNSRMILSGTSSTVGSIIKEFTTDAGAKEYFFPVGSDVIYNPASIEITGSYSGTPSIAIALYTGLHPARLRDEMLNKYWNLSLNGISSVTSTSFTFAYVNDDVNGNNARYIPSLYNSTDGWEINTGLLPVAYPTPITIENTSYIEGDWTAGEADVFFIGRVFYSINTGIWNESTNWSNDKILQHNGPPSSYYPSELYTRDTVKIDGHTIDYNIDYGIIDSMRVGGSNLGYNTAGRGILDFTGTAVDRRALEVNINLQVDEDGRINSSSIAAGGRRDTLTINRSLINNADDTPGFDGGIYLNQGNDDYVVLEFSGTTSSTITGEGAYGNPLVELRINKEDGLADTVRCMSNSFATATGTDPFETYLGGGVLTLSQTSSSLSLPDATFSLTSGSTTVTMQPYSGLNVEHGLMETKTSLHTNIYSTVNVDGGILEVGDEPDECLLYQTGTYISVVDGLLDIAGCFEKLSHKYVINLNIDQYGVLRANKFGNTNIAFKAFNVSNESSTFSMDGGRVIVAQSSNSSSNDYEVSSGNGLGMINGATVQIGDTLLAPPAQNYKIAGTTPMYNLHYVGDAITQITHQNLYINNDWTVDEFHLADLNDNTIYLGGNFMNSGTFDSHSDELSTDARQMILTGSSNTQTLYNLNSDGLDFYNLRIDKAGGSVLLGTDNSHIFVRNTLEFSLNNNAVLNGAQNSQYVELSPAGTSNPSVSRNGYGHVNGLLYRYITTGAITKKFDVGGDTASSSYRPVTITTVGAGGTAGLIGVMPHNTDHTELGLSTIKTTTNVQRYWTLSDPAPFSLGARTYKITTQFVNPGDLVNNPMLVFFEHGFYSPALPSSPPTSTWTYPQVLSRSDTTVTTTNNVEFGDYVVGEPLGIFFYSYADGDWYDENSWSFDGYTTKSSTISHLPGQGLNDFVKIGNGRKITMPAGGPYPTVKSVEVEMFNNLPGRFYIQGEIGYVKGDNFELEDSCELGIQNLTGIEGAGNNGAVRMSTAPQYGVSRYVYNSSYGPQISGKALPSEIKSLIIDNTSAAPNNRVFISTYAGAPDVYIKDSLNVNYGELNCGNRDIHLFGNMMMNNNAVFDPLSKDVSFESATYSPPFHSLEIGNQVGVNFYNLYLLGGNIVVQTNPTYDADDAHIYIENLLNFDYPTDLTINGRDLDRKVVIQTGATLTRTQNTGFVDGILQKPVDAGAGSTLFEIGYGSDYAPGTLILDGGAGGTAGGIDGVNNVPVPFEPNDGNRLDPDKSVPRWWSFTVPSSSAFTLGARTFNLNLQFPPAELVPVDITKAAVRRKSIPAESPLWSQRFGGDLTWNVGLASVELSPQPTVQWSGFGEFYVGEKLPRTFYSRQDGLWNINTTWTFDPSHIGAAVTDGEYPNLDESELNDNVEIGLTHTVTLNVTESKIDTLKIKNDSKLDMLSNQINCFDCPSSGLFIMSENAFISFEGTSIPSATGTMINFDSYVVGINSTIEFYGTQTLPQYPFGLSQYDGNVLINQVGTKLINTPLLIQGNLTISNNAVLQINNINALQVLNNVINSASLINNGVIEIGTP